MSAAGAAPGVRPPVPDEPAAIGGAVPDNVSPEPTIEDYFTEERVFPPPDAFRERAVVTDPGVYDEASGLGPEFWARQAGALDWYRPWDTVLSWDLPFARWFDGGTLNVSYNCLDRHVAAGRGDDFFHVLQRRFEVAGGERLKDDRGRAHRLDLVL